MPTVYLWITNPQRVLRCLLLTLKKKILINTILVPIFLWEGLYYYQAPKKFNFECMYLCNIPFFCLCMVSVWLYNRWGLLAFCGLVPLMSIGCTPFQLLKLRMFLAPLGMQSNQVIFGLPSYSSLMSRPKSFEVLFPFLLRVPKSLVTKGNSRWY